MIMILGLIAALGTALGIIAGVVGDTPLWKILTNVVFLIGILCLAGIGYRLWKKPPAEP
jgi:hypothetical protein